MQILCEFNAQFLWRADHKWLIWDTSVESDLASYAQDEFPQFPYRNLKSALEFQTTGLEILYNGIFNTMKNTKIWHDSSKPHWLGRTSLGYPSCFLGHTPLRRTGSTPQQGGAFPERKSAGQIAWEKPMWININTQRTLLYNQPFSKCHFNSPGRAGHDVVQVRFLEAIKGRGGCYCVGPHVLKDQPVTNL